ncbi:MAG: cobalamin synthesis protein P47K [Bacteroidetes bacterium]|nr:cobalamin synthesis protein P47K [Bacteroidota bacterium]
MINKTRLIIVGGFLGAGKTTLLYETTKLLMNQDKKVGLITNDQASELVDTALLLQTKVKVAEVSGSCFCCNFNGFIDSIKQVGTDSDADIIIAEPVGSCTDLSATIMQPLKDNLNRELIISPLSVLADPIRLADILDGRTAGLHASAAYIFKKQLEESDIILITKKDLLEQDELELLLAKVKLNYPDSEVLSISAKTGKGIDEWLKLIQSKTRTGQRIVEVDYDTYAEGEAVLGWLNSSISLKGEQINWDKTAITFLEDLSQKIDRLNIGVGHIKIILENGSDYLIGNITGTSKTLSIRGKAGISNKAQIIINARIGASPEILDKIVKESLEKITKNKITMKINAWKCLSPGYPNPTFRYNKIIDYKLNNKQPVPNTHS